MRLLTIASVLLVLLALAPTDSVSVGKIDRSQPPLLAELKEPSSDSGIAQVGLQSEVTGEVGEHAQAKIYVLVNPLSNPSTRNTWWVQHPTSNRQDVFRCYAQFGEGRAGGGEYFAVVALATDETYGVGQQLTGLPKARGYSKLRIVKRHD